MELAVAKEALLQWTPGHTLPLVARVGDDAHVPNDVQAMPKARHPIWAELAKDAVSPAPIAGGGDGAAPVAAEAYVSVRRAAEFFEGGESNSTRVKNALQAKGKTTKSGTAMITEFGKGFRTNGDYCKTADLEDAYGDRFPR